MRPDINTPEKNTLDKEISNRLRWELALKSKTAALPLAFLAVVLSYYRFGVSEYATLISILMALCAVNCVFRYFCVRLGIAGQFSKHQVSNAVLRSLKINTILWASTFSLVFFQVEVLSGTFVFTFMVSISLVISSILTLSYVPYMAFFYQVGLMLGITLATALKYQKTANIDFLYMVLCLVTLAFYYYRQTLAFYYEVYQKYKYEVELEASIEELKDSNLRVLKETARAEGASRLAALGEMAGGMAHEINNPLAIASGLLQQALRLTGKESQVAEKIQKASTAIDRIGRIVKSLRHITHTGEESEFFQEIEMGALLEDALNISQERFGIAGIELMVAPMPQTMVKTKRVLISQVLTNLLNNAYYEINTRNESPKFVKLDFKIVDGKMIVFVVNSGPTIPVEIAAKLFQPFFTTKEIGKGTGLGLSICKGIMESLGEKIWHVPEMPHTTFCFTLAVAGQGES